MGLSLGESFSWMGSRAVSILSPWLGSVLGSLWERELEYSLEGAFHGTEENRGTLTLVSHRPFSQRLAALARVRQLSQTMPAAASVIPLLSMVGRWQRWPAKQQWYQLQRTWSWAHLSSTLEWCPKHIQVVDTETVWVLAIFWNHFDDFCLLLERPGNEGLFFLFLL